MGDKKPKIAICYDFDRTLSPKDMQAQGFIQQCNVDVADFWDKSNKLAENNEMDMNLAWMISMLKNAKAKVHLTKDELKKFGAKIELFKGLDKWFDRVNKFGDENGIMIEHYVISSGLKEMIEGTSISDKFVRIYASSFLYDEDGLAIWPAQVVNFTNKTQFLFRIKKGILELNNSKVNEHLSEEEEKQNGGVRFQNMIYIGDSDTDIPCMELVNNNGGYSIGVYDPDGDKTKVYKILKEERINAFVAADYSENSEMDKLIKNIIYKISYDEKIREKHNENVIDYKHYMEITNKDEIRKNELINLLDLSDSFKTTLSIIYKLEKQFPFSDEQIIKLCHIAKNNPEVGLILVTSNRYNENRHLKDFYKELLSSHNKSELLDNDAYKYVFEKISS